MYTRLSYVIGFLIICTLLTTSVYLQFFKGMQPCPLCALQRVCFGLLGIWFALGIVLYARHAWRLTINLLCGITSVLGLFFAGRQIWLQNYPPLNAGECGVSLQYLYKALPFNQLVQKIFEGSAECTERGWEFLHLNMAEWAFTWFVLFILLSAVLLLEEFRWNHKK